MNSQSCPKAAGSACKPLLQSTRVIRRAVWPTVWACGLACTAFVIAVWLLTRGFEYWTFEDLRRNSIQRGELRAPPTAVRTSSGEVRMLFSESDQREAYLVDFIYTSCPTVCRALGSEYQQMHKSLELLPANGIRMLSLSFDGAHDGQVELATYATRYSARPERWIVAAPVTAELSRRLMQRLGVVAIPDGLGGYVHNGDIHLIDSTGIVHGIYGYDQWTEALAGARRLVASAP